MRTFLFTNLLVISAGLVVGSQALAGKLIIKNRNAPSFMINISCKASGGSQGVLKSVGKNSFSGNYVTNMEGSCEQTLPEQKTIPMPMPEQNEVLQIKVIDANSVAYRFGKNPETLKLDAQITLDDKGEVQKIVVKDTEYIKKTRKLMMEKAGPAILELQTNPISKKIIMYMNDLVCKRVSSGLACRSVGGIEIELGQ